MYLPTGNKFFFVLLWPAHQHAEVVTVAVSRTIRPCTATDAATRSLANDRVDILTAVGRQLRTGGLSHPCLESLQWCWSLALTLRPKFVALALRLQVLGLGLEAKSLALEGRPWHKLSRSLIRLIFFLPNATNFLSLSLLTVSELVV